MSSASVPSCILIVGSGVFGLSTAYALARRQEFAGTEITVLERSPFPAPDAASVDASRIVRADYADLVYGKLMAEAMPHWLGDFGAEGRYNPSGLAIIADEAGEQGSRAGIFEDALRNVTERLGLRIGRREDGAEVTVFSDEAGAREAYRNTIGGSLGNKGYVNWTSGWAHAENGIRYMRSLIESTQRVRFRQFEVERLLFSKDSRVVGVQSSSGEELRADLTVLATGAWTGRFLDLRGIASATGQVLAYVSISEEEEKKLSAPFHPVLLCERDGMFLIPPCEGELKVARHGPGYANPMTIPHPERRGGDETITVSLPRTKRDDPHMSLPDEGLAACRDFLRRALPALAERPFKHTRICWYMDTVTGDYLISHHPKYAGLFVATGGSGHAYKFLPSIGERIVDVLRGAEDRDELGAELRRHWAWPNQRAEQDHVWTEDWRGAGPRGMMLDDEYRKGKRGERSG